MQEITQQHQNQGSRVRHSFVATKPRVAIRIRIMENHGERVFHSFVNAQLRFMELQMGYQAQGRCCFCVPLTNCMLCPHFSANHELCYPVLAGVPPGGTPPPHPPTYQFVNADTLHLLYNSSSTLLWHTCSFLLPAYCCSCIVLASRSMIAQVSHFGVSSK